MCDMLFKYYHIGDDEIQFLTRQFSSIFHNSTASKIRMSCFYNVSEFVSVRFDNVKSIYDYAFSKGWGNSNNIESFDAPNLEYIGNSVFGCSNMTHFSAPKVSYIGQYAFQGCTSLTELSFPELTSLYYSMSYGRWNSAYPFSGCTNLKTLYMPKLPVVHDSEFAYLSSLETINLDSCTAIGESAFYQCTHLKSINFSNVETVGSSAFAYCSSVSYIKMDKVETLNAMAFGYCFNSSYVSDGYAEFPELSSMLSYRHFTYCSGLKTFKAPKLKNIGNRAFEYCYNLASLDIPNIEVIESEGFGSCSKLSMPLSFSKCKTIGYRAFGYCGSLSEIHLDTVTSFENEAFNGCISLKEIHMASITSVPTLSGSFGYSLSSLNYIYVPSSLVTAFQTATNWSAYSSLFSGIY